MNTREIEELLTRYFEGETTLEEEKQLREVFRREVPDHLRTYAGLFSTYDESSLEELPDPDFEKKFLKSIGEVPVVAMNSNKRRVLYITSLAAGILLLAGLFFTYTQDVMHRNPKNTVSDPGVAYAQTQKALRMLCMNFQTGVEQVEKFRAFDQGVGQVDNLRRFDDGIQQVSRFSEYYKFQPIVLNPDEKIRP